MYTVNERRMRGYVWFPAVPRPEIEMRSSLSDCAVVTQPREIDAARIHNVRLLTASARVIIAVGISSSLVGDFGLKVESSMETATGCNAVYGRSF